MIYQTNLSTSYSGGRYRQMLRANDSRPIWVYSAVRDNRTREEHKDLHGKAFRSDHPFWEKYYPPNGWNCRCTVYSLNEDQAGKYKIEILSEIPAFVQTNKFCPPEWNYNPGKEKFSPSWDQYTNLKNIKIEGNKKTFLDDVKEVYKNDLSKIAMNSGEWSAKINEITKENYKPQSYDYLISSKNNDFIKNEDARLYVKDSTILFSLRDKKLNKKELKDIPNILQDPDYILKDGMDDAYLYIKELDKEAIKLVFKKENDSVCLTMRTAGKIDKDKLLKTKEYKIIYKK